MSVTSQPRRIRPTSAPAYYLGRPASLWLGATGPRSGEQHPLRLTNGTK